MSKSPGAAPKPTSLIDGTFLYLLAFAVASALACWLVKGPDVFWVAWHGGLDLLVEVAPIMAGAVLLGGFAQALLPHSVVRRWLGDRSGFFGLLLATGAGILVPGGPITSFPRVAALVAAGADVGVTVAFVTSWALLGLNRIVVWELPFLGAHFALVRLGATLLLPLLAGMIARRLPLSLHFNESDAA